MFAQYFLHPMMLAGLAMLAAPIIIHLINRLRFRRVRFAAMEFLLESQQRNRRRVLIEQLLLLMLRCLLVAGIVAIVARPIVGENLAALLSTGQRTEHIVVLDDSYSMGQVHGADTVFQSGLDVVRRLTGALADRPGNHSITVLRTSAIEKPDLLSVRTERARTRSIQNVLDGLRASYWTVGPATGVTQAAKQFEQSDATDHVLHLVTDFRARDWPDESELSTTLAQLSNDRVTIHLIDAAVNDERNLGVDRLTARVGSVAVDVPFRVEASIRNFSAQTVENVAVVPRVDAKLLPARYIEKILPGETASVAFDVQILATGTHRVSVHLPDDVLPADNARYLAVNLRDRVRVLIVDGSPGRTEAGFLALALAPGGSVRTGLEPVIRGPEAIAGAALQEFGVIYLTNVSELDAAAIQALTEFVESGGGLAVFFGDQVQPDRYRGTLAGSSGELLPIDLGNVVVADAAGEPDQPDLLLERHPIFRVFEGERNPFIRAVRIQRYFSLAESIPPAANAKVIARFRDGSPMVIESSRGSGRIMIFLTTASPVWNTWARNPSFVVTALEMQAYLSEPVGGAPQYLVGEPWNLQFDAGRYRRAVSITAPDPQSDEPLVTTVDAQATGLLYELSFTETRFPGLYEIARTRTSGGTDLLARAYNVEPTEGDLQRITADQLAEHLEGVDYRYHRASDFHGDVEEAGFEPRDWLILALVIVLVVEQLLAYRLSYHLH